MMIVQGVVDVVASPMILPACQGMAGYHAFKCGSIVFVRQNGTKIVKSKVSAGLFATIAAGGEKHPFTSYRLISPALCIADFSIHNTRSALCYVY